MAKKFSDLRAKMPHDARTQAERETQAMVAEMPLHELRRARGLSQKMLAEALRVQQPSVAKLERRTDMSISTLRSHIEAMGGELEVIAKFPEGVVKINNFGDLGRA
jgi:DNA-binding transcriptional regulator YiaG